MVSQYSVLLPDRLPCEMVSKESSFSLALTHSVLLPKAKGSFAILGVALISQRFFFLLKFLLVFFYKIVEIQMKNESREPFLMLPYFLCSSFVDWRLKTKKGRNQAGYPFLFSLCSCFVYVIEFINSFMQASRATASLQLGRCVLEYLVEDNC